jgi:hypothetical protein
MAAGQDPPEEGRELMGETQKGQDKATASKRRLPLGEFAPP